MNAGTRWLGGRLLCVALLLAGCDEGEPDTAAGSTGMAADGTDDGDGDDEAPPDEGTDGDTGSEPMPGDADSTGDDDGPMPTGEGTDTDEGTDGTDGTTGDPGTDAVDRGLLARYTFEGKGSTVADVSGVGDPLDLTMYREQYIERIEHGVRFLPTPDAPEDADPDYTTPIIRSAGAADKVNAALEVSDAFSLEVWLMPTELEQSGPGRVVSIDYTNYESTNFNAMHGPPNCGDHGTGSYFQLRMGGTGNACPALTVPDEPNVSGELQHFVFTQDGTSWVLYLDGQVNISGEHDATPAGWNDIAGMAFGNLPYLPEEGAAHGNFRAWVGELYYVGWHDVALTADEVATNFAIPYQDR